MRECKYCGCFLPEGADTCLSCGKPQEENKKVEMTNQTIKENLLVMMEGYIRYLVDSKEKSNARKTIMLALKAIDAYTVCAGNLDDQEK